MPDDLQVASQRGNAELRRSGLVPSFGNLSAVDRGEQDRFESMVFGLPLRLPGGTGSPRDPIAIN